jgi:hypothetical protein
MLWFKLERVGLTAGGPQAEVHTAQTFAIRVIGNGLGKSIGRNGGEIGDDLKTIWTHTATAAEPFWIDPVGESAAKRASTLHRT